MRRARAPRPVRFRSGWVGWPPSRSSLRAPPPTPTRAGARFPARSGRPVDRRRTPRRPARPPPVTRANARTFERGQRFHKCDRRADAEDHMAADERQREVEAEPDRANVRRRRHFLPVEDVAVDRRLEDAERAASSRMPGHPNLRRRANSRISSAGAPYKGEKTIRLPMSVSGWRVLSSYPHRYSAHTGAKTMGPSAGSHAVRMRTTLGPHRQAPRCRTPRRRDRLDRSCQLHLKLRAEVAAEALPLPIGHRWTLDASKTNQQGGASSPRQARASAADRFDDRA